MAITGDDVNKLFTINGDDAWRCISYCEHPTATFEHIKSGERIGGAVHSPNVQQFKRLVIEEKGGQ